MGYFDLYTFDTFETKSQSNEKFMDFIRTLKGLPWLLSDKGSACDAGDSGDTGLIPGLGRSPGGGHGNPLQYSCLENTMDRGAWWATVQRVTESTTEATKQTCIHRDIKS